MSAHAEKGAVPAPGRLETERYLDSISGVAGWIGAVEVALEDLEAEGWPTKLRGDVGERFERIAGPVGEIEREAERATPAAVGLRPTHDNLLELAAGFRRLLAAAQALAERPGDAEREDEVLAARQETEREAGELKVSLQQLAAETGADLAPLDSAIAPHRTTLGRRLKRVGRRLVIAFLPIVPVSAQRLFVVPFRRPYGPLAPPRILRAAAAWFVLGKIPVVGSALGIAAAFSVYMIGMLVSVWYYALLLTWWAFGMLWISIALTLLRGRSREPAAG